MGDEWIEISVPVERKTWIRGRITAKCRSIAIDSDSCHQFQSSFEIQKVLESKIDLRYSLSESKKKQPVIKAAHTKAKINCVLKLPSKIETFIGAEDGQYRLVIKDLKFIKPPNISNVLVEDDFSYALYKGDVVGYVVDTIYETKLVKKHNEESATEIYNEPVKQIKTPDKPEVKKRPIRVPRSSQDFGSGCLGSIPTIMGILFWGFILISFIRAMGTYSIWFALALIVAYLLSVYGNNIVRSLGVIFRVLGILILFGVVVAFISDITSKTNWRHRQIDDSDEIKSSEVIQNNDEIFENITSYDTLIVQKRVWNDYDGNKYSTDLKIRKEDFRAATHYRENKKPINGFSEFNNLYYDLIEYSPENSFKFIYENLDTIRVNRGLSRSKFAEVIVSMVQDIPYTLVLPADCEWQMYQDQFVRQYLQSGKECVPNTRNGIFSPEEFMVNLTGDCDTRTLVLFKILFHYNYDVRILNSEEYSHSILAINSEYYSGTAFVIDGKRYVTWETTSTNTKPGTRFENLDNQKYWKTALY